jgi:hypothetical protein
VVVVVVKVIGPTGAVDVAGFVIVKVCQSPLSFWATEPKLTEAGETAVGLTVRAEVEAPVPARVAVAVSPPVDAVTVTIAPSAPAMLGAKVTTIVQVSPGARVLPTRQVPDVSWKSAAFVPPTATERTPWLAALVVLLVTVRVCAVALEPTRVVPAKTTADGAMVSGPLAMPVNANEAVPPAVAVAVTVAAFGVVRSLPLTGANWT